MVRSALGAAGVVLWREHRFDPEVPFLFAAIMFGEGVFLHLVTLALMGTENILISAAIMSGLACCFVVGLLRWRVGTKGGQGLPNILEQRLGLEIALETNEVQWAVAASSELLNAESEIQLILQNCAEAECRCTVSFEEDSRAKPGKGYFAYPEPFELALKAGEIVRCSIPVRPRHRDKADLLA